MSAAARFRASGALVLVRGTGEDLEIYWVRRSQQVSFMPGFHAFPGGVVGPGDADLPMAGIADEDERARRACALRETFEEVGLLPSHAGDRSPATLAEAREQLLCGDARFVDLAQQHGWRFDPRDLEFAGRWLTPPFSAMRFDAAYYLARPPEDQQPSIGEAELDLAEWIRPAAAIAQWKRGEALFAAPILMTLREAERGDERLAARMAAAAQRTTDAAGGAGSMPHRIELAWGVVLRPMATRPLPPATHTNAYLVGDREMALLDPGSGDTAELAALDALIEGLGADGRRLACVLVTHAHPDHVGGVAAVRERYRVPVLGHASLADAMRLDRTLADGERVSLAGDADWTLTAIHAPGHARGHLCFFQERIGALFSGDHVAGSGTVIVDPPEGDMADYVASLEKLAALAPRTLFPGHGSPQGAALRKIRALVAHRLERERKVLEALAEGPAPLAALVAIAYADTKPELWPYAERSLLAHLLKLEREGRAQRHGERWRSARGGAPGVPPA